MSIRAWTTLGDLKTQVNRLWDRGELVRPLVNGDAFMPLRLVLKGPASSELAERFPEVRAWLADIAEISHIRFEWREVNHRILGLQRLPESAWVESLDDALALVGKRADAAKFRQMVEVTRAERPELLEWLAKRPIQAIGLHDRWSRLLDVVAWLHAHPHPGVYLRQVDIPGVHTKFIEANRGLLTELLDLVLPAECIVSERTGSAQFAARYGFLQKPNRIRFRVLDERIGFLPGAELPDVTLDATTFSTLSLPVRHVFITENETNFLAFPRVPGALVVFGSGYGWDALGRANWLQDCEIHYWGDIDTHGFAILNQLRGQFGHVSSLLMDRGTLMAHVAMWGKEPDQATYDLPLLNSTERAMYNDLRDNTIRLGLRLEQEHIGFGCLLAALNELATRNGDASKLGRCPQGDSLEGA